MKMSMQVLKRHRLVRMDTDTKNLISRVLRSGKYQQGTEYSTTSRCTCIGGIIMQTYMKMHGFKYDDVKIPHFLAWMGLSDEEVDAFSDNTEDWNNRFNHREIADLIDKNY